MRLGKISIEHRLGDEMINTHEHALARVYTKTGEHAKRAMPNHLVANAGAELLSFPPRGDKRQRGGTRGQDKGKRRKERSRGQEETPQNLRLSRLEDGGSLRLRGW